MTMEKALLYDAKGNPIPLDRLRREEKAPVPMLRAGAGPIPSRAGTEEYLRAYRGWVYTVVRRIAETAAAVELGLYRTVRRNGREIDEQIYNHPVLALLDRPNPFWTRFDLFERTIQYLELAGEAYWVFSLDSRGRPAEIWAVPPHWVKVVPSRTNFISGYVYQAPGQQPVPLSLNEVLVFQYPSPLNLARGMGTVEAAAMAIDREDFMSRYERNFYLNGAVPLGVLETENFLSETEYKRLKEQWNAQHQGLANAHKIAVLEEGVKFKPISIPAKDLQLVESRRQVRDEILAMFGVSQAVLGITEDINRANAEAQMAVFAKTAILPRLKRLEARINEFLIPRFGDPNLFVKFDDPVPENRELRMQELKLLADRGAIKLNELREEYGLPPEPEFDVALQPANYMPVGSSGGNEQQEEPEQRSMATPGSKALDREAYWKQFVQRLDGREAEFKRRLKKVFQEQQNQISRRIRDGAASPEEVLEGVDEEWARQLARELGPLIREALLGAGREAIAQVQPRQAAVKDLDMDPYVVDWLQNRIVAFAVQVSETTIKALQATLIEGYLNGDRPAQLVDRVAEVFREAKGPRAERIARTEMVRAMNHGTLFGWRQTGLVVGKEWVAALDERTRPDHMHADGQVVPLHEKFTVGGWPMEVPGDPSAPAEQVVNCRCTVAPVVEGDMP